MGLSLVPAGPNEEKELSEYLITSAKVGFGKTRRQIKDIAESVAKEKGMLKGERISNGWWRRFLERNPTISLRSGDSTAQVRMQAINRENVEQYHNLLKDVLDEFDLENHPEQIYNMDESRIPLDPRPLKVAARKGQKKVR